MSGVESKVKWSFSGLKDYVNCPKQYYEVKIKQNYVKNITEQMRYGTEVHSALENYAEYNVPLPKNYERFKSVMDEFAKITGTHYNEYKMALTADKVPCKFDDPEYWVRGIADRIIISGDQGYVIDYKTGSARYPDPKQLLLMALFMFAYFPELAHVKGALWFAAHNIFIDREYKREDINWMWSQFAGDLMRLTGSVATNSWPCNPTPLCGWCPVRECEFHTER